MKKLLLLLAICILAGKSLIAQEEAKTSKYSISAGVNLFMPTMIYRNEDNFGNLNPSWVAMINRYYHLSSMSSIIASIGFREDAFTAERPSMNPGSEPTVRKITLGYAQLGIDYRLEKQMGNYSIFGGAGFRGSILAYENFTSLYSAVRMRDIDVGSNISGGVKFLNLLGKPSIQLSYYHGLRPLARNYVRFDNGELFLDELRGRSMNLILTFHL